MSEEVRASRSTRNTSNIQKANFKVKYFYYLLHFVQTARHCMTYIYAILTNYDFKWHMSTSDLIQLLILMIATASLFYKIGTKK